MCASVPGARCTAWTTPASTASSKRRPPAETSLLRTPARSDVRRNESKLIAATSLAKHLAKRIVCPAHPAPKRWHVATDSRRGDAFLEFLYQNVAEPLATEDTLAHELQMQAGISDVIWWDGFDRCKGDRERFHHVARSTCSTCSSVCRILWFHRFARRRCQVDVQRLPAEWQFVENPVACAAVGVEGRRGTRKDICWLPPGTVSDLFEQLKATSTPARPVETLETHPRSPLWLKLYVQPVCVRRSRTRS